MSAIDHLATWHDQDRFHVVVEAPAGSRLKYTYDEKLKLFVISRPLALGISYPFDWGFVPGTRAADGDPLDAMVLSDIPSYPGVVHICHPVGVVRLTQKEGTGKRVANDRVIAIPAYRCALADTAVEHGLSKERRDELERFFINASLFEGKAVRIEGWDGPKAAVKIIKHGVVS